MNQLLETKVTRAELLDIILEDLLAELREKEADAEKRREALPPFDQRKFLALLPASAEIEVNTHCGKYDDQIKVDISFRLPHSSAPAGFWERFDANKRLEEEESKYRMEIRSLENNRSRAKAEVIRKMLEGSDEGVKLLAQVAEMKLAIKRKLLPAALP